jgi:hypothetical protein
MLCCIYIEDIEPNSGLIDAVKHLNYRKTKYYLNKRADPNRYLGIKNAMYTIPYTLLLLQPIINDKIQDDAIKILDLLIEYGGDIGGSYLFNISEFENQIPKVVKYIATHPDADLCYVSDKGESVLSRAVKNENIELLQIMFDKN